MDLIKRALIAYNHNGKRSNCQLIQNIPNDPVEKNLRGMKKNNKKINAIEEINRSDSNV